MRSLAHGLSARGRALALSAIGSLLGVAAGCVPATTLIREEQPAGGVAWVRRFGDAAEQRITALAVDGDGNIVVAGTGRGAIDFGGGPLVADGRELFVAKLAPDGRHVWSRAFQTSFQFTANGVAIDAAGDIALVGTFEGFVQADAIGLTTIDGDDGYALVLNSAGKPLSAFRFTGAGVQRAWSATFDAHDQLVVVGEFASDLLVESAPFTTPAIHLVGKDQMFLARFDPPNFLGAYGYGDDQPQRASRVISDGTDVLVGGTLNGTASFAGEPLAAKGTANPFVAKLDDLGRPGWTGAFGDGDVNCFEWCEIEIAHDAGHRVLVTGAFTGALDVGGVRLKGTIGADVFVAALEPDGVAGHARAVWATRFGDILVQRPYGLAVLGGDQPVVAGTFQGDIVLGGDHHHDDDAAADWFVAGYDAGGAVRWSRQFATTAGSPDLNEPGGPRVVALRDGRLALAGSFRGAIAVDAAQLTTTGDADYDALLMVLAPP